MHGSWKRLYLGFLLGLCKSRFLIHFVLELLPLFLSIIIKTYPEAFSEVT